MPENQFANATSSWGLSEGVTGSKMNIFPVIVFPLCISGAAYKLTENNDAINSEFLSLVTFAVLVFIMGYCARQTTLKARLNPVMY